MHADVDWSPMDGIDRCISIGNGPISCRPTPYLQLERALDQLLPVPGKIFPAGTNILLY